MAKISWKSEEDKEKEELERQKQESLPSDKARIEMLENMVLDLLMTGVKE